MKKILILLIVLLPIIGFSQVELFSNDATKFYPDGTRISYLTLSDYPIESEFLDFVNSNVIKDTRIIRFSIYKDGHTCFVESENDFSDEMLIDAINESYISYFSQPKVSNSSSMDETKKNVNTYRSGVSTQRAVKTNNLNPDYSKRSFTKKSDGKFGYYRVGFKIENTPNGDNIKNATIVLKERGNFEDVIVNDETYFEISSSEPISADFVIEILEEFGLKIDDEFIK